MKNVKPRAPKILLYDIETKPVLGLTWGKYDQNLLHIVEDFEVLSVAYKWHGENSVKCLSRSDGAQTSDKKILARMQELFHEADLLVAHNGDKFDYPKLKARMIYHRLPPMKIPTTVDTKKVAKNHFAFTGNSLADLAQFLGLQGKVKNPGIEMWLGCMKGDKASWALMEKYNKRDVGLLEEVYNIFLPWIENHPNLALLLNPELKDKTICPNCGGKDAQPRGYRATAAQVKRQMLCGCGRWFLVPLSVKKVEK